MNAGGPAVKLGDTVVVLRWAHMCHIPTPHTGVAQALELNIVSPLNRVCRVSHPGGGTTAHWGPGLWASSWRHPTPEELAAYQLSQLVGGGL